MDDEQLTQFWEWADNHPHGPARSRVMELVAEVRRLRAQVEGHCERIAKQSELPFRSAEKAPSYRRDLPTEPGWYWMRSLGGKPKIVEVFYHNRRDATDGLHWHGTWSSGFIREAHADYWWAGPIKEPGSGVVQVRDGATWTRVTLEDC